MNYNITPAMTPSNQNVALPSPMIIQTIGEEGMRKLVSDHYDLLAQSDIKDMFPPKPKLLEIAKKNSADFFIQICGGHPHFNENRGAPRMRARHMPFKITPEARIVWLETYAQALEKTELSDELKTSFWDYINIFSIWMLNTPSENQ